MTADAIGPLLAMQQATTIHDAHRCAVDAAKAGATDAEVGQAITEWMALQAAQVQTVSVPPKLPRDGEGRLIWDWICLVCHVEWTSGDGCCPTCHQGASDD